MTLSASSPLFYVDPRYGVIPIVGGAPHHTRSSAAAWIDQSGGLHSAVVNTPRFVWQTIRGERRMVLRLERAGTNGVGLSDQIDNAAWLRSGLAGVTANAFMAPDGTVTMDKLVESAVNEEHYVDMPVPATTANVSQAAYIVARAAERSWLHLSSVDKAGTVIRSWFNLATGVLGTVGAGHTARMYPLKGGSYLCAIVFSAGTGATALRVVCGMATADGGLAYAGDGVSGLYLWRGGFEADRDAESSPIATPTSAAASRLADQLYWDYLASSNQDIIVYSAMIEQNTLAADSRVWQIGASGDTNPRLILGWSGSARRLHWQNAAGTTIVSDAPDATVKGEFVEHACVIRGGTGVRLIQRRNGAAVTAGATSAALALPSAWGDTKLWANSVGTTSPGMIDLAQLKIVKYADVVASTDQGIMDEVAAFEMSANGEVVVTGS